MKNKNACALAGFFLAIIAATSIFNFIYVQNTARNITDALEALPEGIYEASKELSEVQSLWEDRRVFLDLTLSKPVLEKISSLFEEVIISAESNNEEEYKKSMARLMRAIEDIRDLEIISIDNIF